jgi:hypothetical protein
MGQETRFCATCGQVAALNSPHTPAAAGEEAATRGLDVAAPRPAPAWDKPGDPPDAPGGSVPPAPSGTDTAQFPANWMDNIGFRPQWERPGPPPAYGDAGPRPPSQHRPRRLLALGLFTLLAAMIAVPALLILHSFHAIGGSPAAQQRPRSAAASPAQQRAAAAGLAALLARSVTDRDAISNAVVDVNHCGPALTRDSQTFRSAAHSRQLLLSQLADLPGRSALPGAMVRALSGAWQASIAADEDLARWAQDEASGGCAHTNHADPNLAASNGPDQQATADKTAFVSLWNAIAATYQLTTYQTGQL